MLSPIFYFLFWYFSIEMAVFFFLVSDKDSNYNKMI